MLGGAYQVVDVLMLVLCIAPVAVYFLTLGLVNSHSRPWMVSSRSDFVSLTIVLIPILIGPLPMLASGRNAWLLVTALILLVVGFAKMLPSRRSGFVIYNISESRCIRLLRESIAAMGWSGFWSDSVWRSHDGSMCLSLRAFAPLRNVTLHFEGSRTPSTDEVRALQADLESRFHRIAQMPTAMGACLVMLGLALMVVPMWMVSRHIDDLVDAMSHLFG